MACWKHKIVEKFNLEWADGVCFIVKLIGVALTMSMNMFGWKHLSVCVGEEL